MKKWIVCLIEILGYVAYIACLVKAFPERLEGISVPWLVFIPIIAFFVVNVLQILLETGLRKRLSVKHNNARAWQFQTIVFAVAYLIFFAANAALEKLANMPASFCLLVWISLMSTCIHMFFSWMINRLLPDRNELVEESNRRY